MCLVWRVINICAFWRSVICIAYYERYTAAIQEAIDAAVDGDVIIVHPETYYENIHFLGKNIVLTSTDIWDRA